MRDIFAPLFRAAAGIRTALRAAFAAALLAIACGLGGCASGGAGGGSLCDGRQRRDGGFRIDRRPAAAGVRAHGERARQRIEAAQPSDRLPRGLRPRTACAAISPPRSAAAAPASPGSGTSTTATSSARCALSGEEPAGKAGRDAWAAADDLLLRRIAQAGLSGLSAMINGTAPAEAPPPAPAPGRRGPAVASAELRFAGYGRVHRAAR